MLAEQIKKDLVAAMKEKNEAAVSTLRMLNSALFNKEMEKRVSILEKEPNLSEEEVKEKMKLADAETIEAVASEVKKRRDSIAGFEQGGRQDLVDKEKKELDVLLKYMPQELSEEEIRKVVKEAIAKTGVADMKGIGMVMKEVQPQTKGRADGNLVAKIVKEELGGH